VLLIACTGITSAQTKITDGHRRSSQVVDDWVTLWGKQLVGVADAMPADKYSFAPAGEGFIGVRTFAQQIKHAAATNYILAASALGEKTPDDAGDETGPERVRTKADIIEYLKGSFVSLHQAASAIDDENTLITSSPISPLQNKGTRLGFVIEALFHTANHYGQTLEYLRMNGVIPPASR